MAKTDRIDARLLAVMAEGLRPASVAPLSPAMEDLQELMHIREATVTVAEHTALLNQIGASYSAFARRELERRKRTLAASLTRIEREIRRLIEADAKLAARYAIARSILGVGPVAAATLVIGLTELGSCSGKEAAMLAGLAPVACDSGEQKGARHIRGGRANVRRAIYMAAVAATRCNPALKTFYERLIAVGKRPKVALTAVMRKLVVLANTLFSENRCWLPLGPKAA